MWVADDGSYGSGDVEEFDVSNWTDEDFQEFDEADDSTRLYVARQINHERNAAQKGEQVNKYLITAVRTTVYQVTVEATDEQNAHASVESWIDDDFQPFIKDNKWYIDVEEETND